MLVESGGQGLCVRRNWSDVSSVGRNIGGVTFYSCLDSVQAVERLVRGHSFISQAYLTNSVKIPICHAVRMDSRAVEDS